MTAVPSIAANIKSVTIFEREIEDFNLFSGLIGLVMLGKL